MIVVWLLAIFFTCQSIGTLLRSSFNMGALLVYLITGALWAYAFFHRPINAFCSQGVGAVFKWLFFAGCLLLAGLVAFVVVTSYQNSAKGDEKAIIVLGAGLRGETPSGMLTLRLQAAHETWRQNPEAYLVVTGGQGPDEAIPEAVAMARWLKERGVPEDKILMEDKSVSTRENFAFALELLREKGVRETDAVAFATTGFHCWRAAQYARMAGFAEVRAIPAGIPPATIIPSYLREAFAVLYYAVFRR